ncbi:L-carnitine dehydratase/bile acid-inducible F domain protein [Mycobacterium xenopi 3993]|nr:L-carnitine dehydratase/bile acid-inducible F domain protein [Mycobacterium xenopi 3993]
MPIAVGLDPAARSRPTPQWISLWRFDLDHLCSTVGEQLGAVGASDTGGQVDDDVPVQRLHVLAVLFAARFA